jgi:hypothetical protein
MPRKIPDPAISVDQAIKELLQIRPADTLAFLLPEVVAQRGLPCSWLFHNIQVRKKDLVRKGLIMDLNIEYRFLEGDPLLMVLVEHWSTARSVDLLRTAQYFLDLSGRFPRHEVVPVALITEMDGPSIVDHIVRNALGREVLRFATYVVQLSQTQAQTWSRAGNLVAATLLTAMGGTLSRAQKLQATIQFFQSHDAEETKRLFPLISEVGKFTHEEHAMTYKYLSQLPKPLFMTMLEDHVRAELTAEVTAEVTAIVTAKVRDEVTAKVTAKAREEGLDSGLERGIRSSKLEDARRMLARDCDWAFITDITGIRPEDLDVKSPA